MIMDEYVGEFKIASFTQVKSWRIQLQQAMMDNSWARFSQVQENDAEQSIGEITSYANESESEFNRFQKLNSHPFRKLHYN